MAIGVANDSVVLQRILDRAHFYLPGFNVFSGSAGHITRLVSSPGGRLTQLALKVVF